MEPIVVGAPSTGRPCVRLKGFLEFVHLRVRSSVVISQPMADLLKLIRSPLDHEPLPSLSTPSMSSTETTEIPPIPVDPVTRDLFMRQVLEDASSGYARLNIQGTAIGPNDNVDTIDGAIGLRYASILFFFVLILASI
jgi:hypothetical protein